MTQILIDVNEILNKTFNNTKNILLMNTLITYDQVIICYNDCPYQNNVVERYIIAEFRNNNHFVAFGRTSFYVYNDTLTSNNQSLLTKFVSKYV